MFLVETLKGRKSTLQLFFFILLLFFNLFTLICLPLPTMKPQIPIFSKPQLIGGPKFHKHFGPPFNAFLYWSQTQPLT